MIAVEPRLDYAPAMLELTAQGDQTVAVARLGLLRMPRLEEHDVAIQESGHPMDQPVAQSQQDEPDARQSDDREHHSQEPESHPQDAERAPNRLVCDAVSIALSSCSRANIWATNPKGSDGTKSIRRWRRK